MSFVLIIALTVAVLSLWWIATQQKKSLKKYENELLKKSKKGKK